MAKLSKTREARLREQGFEGSNEQLCAYAPGIRAAYITCVLVVFLGLVFQYMPLLYLALIMAFLAVVMPRHPVDYIYIALTRKTLPNRTNQGKFACAIATLTLVLIIYLFSIGNDLWAYIFGGLLLFSGSLVGFFDKCIPSVFYNKFIKKSK